MKKIAVSESGRLGSNIAALLAVLVALTGCQPTFLLNQLTPRDGFRLERDLSYGSDPRQQLDLYVPVDRVPNAAVVVFVHGGGWDSGDKSQYLFVGEAFTSLGYVTAIPNYRLYPQVQFPAFIDDVARAIAALAQLLPASTCTRPPAIILIGHSAGAHTAAMLTTEPKYLARNNAGAELRVFIGLAGPYDLPLQDPAVVGKFDTLTSDLEANPIALATADMPRTLLVHGNRDTTVGLHHTQRLSAKLQELGVPVTVKVYAETNHTRLVGALAKPVRFLNPVLLDIAQFLRESALDAACR